MNQHSRALADSKVSVQHPKPLTWHKIKEKLVPYGFLSPFIILFAVFSVFPLFFSMYLSFHIWNPVGGLSTMKWVGLENYVIALEDPWLWKSLRNTAWMGIISGVLIHGIALPVAYILVSVGGRIQQILVSAYFLPFITSIVAIAMIFSQMYSAESGIINKVLSGLAANSFTEWLFGGLADVMPLRWLEDTALVKPAITFVLFWRYVGFTIVLYVSGLMTIPKDLHEAAIIDGANPLQRFWRISLPLLRPFIFFAVTLSIIGSFQMFEEPFVLTNGTGGIGQSALTVSMFLYKVGWDWLEMGTASAISWLLFVLIIIFTIGHFFLFGRKGMGGN